MTPTIIRIHILFFSCTIEAPRHQATKTCKCFASIRKDEEHQTLRESNSIGEIRANSMLVEKVKSFKHLGRHVSTKDCDGEAMHHQLKQATRQWGMMSKVLSSKGADARTMATFYATIVLSVLLHGSSTWVLSEGMMGKLKSFHHRCGRWTTGRHVKKESDGTWACPRSEDVLRKMSMPEIDVLITQQRKSYLINSETHLFWNNACLLLHTVVLENKKHGGSYEKRKRTLI